MFSLNARTQMTVLWSLFALLPVGCHDSNPGGCKDSPGVCSAGQVCDLANNQCVISVSPDLGGPNQMCSPDGWCSTVPLPQGNDLLGVWGLNASNIWAVGSGGTLLKWGGASWTIQTSNTTNELHGVWALDPNNVWAVGVGGTILKGNYDLPIRTYTDPRMEMSCGLPRSLT